MNIENLIYYITGSKERKRENKESEKLYQIENKYPNIFKKQNIHICIYIDSNWDILNS